ncbi:MAG: dihydroneopterin aldolase [Propioniciclava sp.]
MSDDLTITLTGVTARGHHGVFAAERRDGQPFIVDAAITLNRSPTADDLATTLDYGAAARTIVAIIEGEPVDLIETLAVRILEALGENPAVRRLTVTVHKPQAPIDATFADVSVTLTRTVR